LRIGARNSSTHPTGQRACRQPANFIVAGHSAHGPLEPALRDYILLITILVAFLEAMAQQLRPYQPPVVMGFSGVLRQVPTH
jgi:hypothetical protein